MPSIDVAMARSLEPGAWQTVRDAVARSVASELMARDVVGDTQQKVTDVQTAFSSWDNCMAASFCKYPLITIIAVVGLIIIGIVWCIVRCCCCGMSCCCSCFRCLKCCGDCCGCCDPPGRDKKGHADEPYAPPYQGYQPQGPMQAPFVSHAAPPPPSQPAVHPVAAAPPQYAEFDVQRKGGEDALPEMPSWEGAGSRKVEVEEDAVELEPLKKSAAPPPMGNPPTANMQANDFGSRQPSPNAGGQSSPYGPPQGSQMGGQGGYMPAPRTSPNPGQGPIGRPPQAADEYGLDRPYDVPFAAAAAVPRHADPARDQDPYGQYHPDGQQYAEMPGAPGDQPGLSGYGSQQPRRSPAPQAGGPAGYGMQRQGTGDSRRGPDGHGMQRQGTGDGRRGPDGYGMQRQYTGESRPGPDGYGMQRQGTGDSRRGPDGYGMQRQYTGESRPGPDGYGMRRQGTGDRMNNASPAPYGAVDPRARQSPGPGPRRTPGPPDGGPHGPGPRRTPGPAGNSPYGPGPGPRRTPGPQEDSHYNQGPRGSPRPFDQNPRASPGPQRQMPYGSNPPQDMPPRQAHAQDYPTQEAHMPAQPPAMQYNSPPQSPIVNNGGFDFTSGFARPSPQTSPTADTYPGYKPYAPAQQPWNGV